MKQHLFTVGLLLVALALYAAGLTGLGSAFLVAGGACELWFWRRVLRGRQPTPRPLP